MVDFELRILPDLEVMMKEFWLKKRFSALTASVVMVAAVAISFLGWFLPRPEAAPVSGTPVTTRQLYQAAVEDAVEADSGEVMPLVCVTPDDDMVTWNDAGDKVLMLSWHRYPESYPNGESITLQYGEVWTFTDKEIKAWYQKNKVASKTGTCASSSSSASRRRRNILTLRHSGSPRRICSARHIRPISPRMRWK